MNENGMRICIKDQSRKYIYCNELFASDLGLGVSQILGKDDFDFAERSHAEEFSDHDKYVLETGKPVISCVRRKIGANEVFFKVSRIPYITEESKLSGILAISEEINGELFLRERLIETIGETDAFEVWDLDIESDTALRREGTGSIIESQIPASLEDFEKLFHREDRGKLSARIKEHSREEGSFKLQVRLEEYPGRRKWIDLSGVSRGGKAHFIINDITRYIISEKTLLLYEQAFANAIGALVLTDSCGGFIRVNEAFYTFWNTEDPHFLNGRKTEILLENKEDWLAIMEGIAASGSWKGEVPARKTDGTHFVSYLTVSRIVSEEDSIDYLLWTFLDNSEKHSLVERITDQAEQFDVFVKTTMDGYWLVDEMGYLRDCNERACSMLGYSRDEMIGMHLEEIDVNEMAGDFRRHMVQVKKSGSDIFKTRHKKKNGQLLDIHVSTTYWPQKRQFIGFVRDITAIEKNKKELEELNIALRIVIESERRSSLSSEKNMNLALQKTVFPLLNQLSEGCSDTQKEIISLIRDSLNLSESYPIELTAVLSPRELQVAQMIYQGYVSKEIGNIMNMSGRTVENYRQSIRKKLKITNPSENLNNIIAAYFNGM